MRLFSVSYIVFFIFVQGLFTGCVNGEKQNEAIKNTKISEEAMVVSAHPLASKIGLEILQKGGNAIDAAVAVQFALSVVYPRAGNIGGGGFAVIRLADGDIKTLDFREKAPITAFRDMYLDTDGNVIPNKSESGIFSVGIPGTVAGMEAMHRKYGKIPWDDLVAPSIKLAIMGFPLTTREAASLNKYRDVFLEMNPGKNPFVKETEWLDGDTIKYLEYAEALFRIGEKGAQEFYHGRVANQIVAESKKRGGIITKKDLLNYKPIWREPVSANLGEYTVYSMGPPSSGGIALIQLLKGSQQFDLEQYSHNSAKAIHLMTELERRVFADRAVYLGDSDFYKVPQQQLVNDAYLKERFKDVNLDKSTLSSNINAGEIDLVESNETTHYSIVDKWGNAVSITTTLNGNYGSKVIVSGAGFFLNNEMDDFSVKPGEPNQFGLVGGEANSVQPEKRMLSSMSPTIVEKNGNLWMVVGTPGGATIITSTYQTIQNCMWYGMTMQESVNAPKTHSQWLPDVVYLEKGKMDKAVIDSLQQMGHEIKYRKSIGKMSAIRVLDDGKLEGAPDYTRGENTAEGS